MIFPHQPAGGEVVFGGGGGGAVGGGGLPGNFGVIPIVYAMVETVSLSIFLFQH